MQSMAQSTQAGTELRSHLPGYIEEARRTAFEAQVLGVLSAIAARGNHSAVDLDGLRASPVGQAAIRSMERGDALVFLLPAFPAKSSNRRKTEGPAPDLGELLGLQNLERMCREIEAVYAPGARVVIASDGRVFRDLVMVSPEDLELYRQGIEAMIRDYGLSHLGSFSLEDAAELFGESPEKLVVERFAPRLEDVRELVRTDPEQRRMFDGIHRFMQEDLSFHHPELSRSQLEKRSKSLAYQVIQRSRAWDALLATRFPGTLRLSIHPYPMVHRKFGVKLVPGSDRWATPWHNVVVREGGRFTLRKRHEALSQGAVLRFFDGKLAFYALD